MSVFSLINVAQQHDNNTVDGYWLQDFVGDLEAAEQRAAAIESANSNSIQVAVIQQVSSPVPALDWHTSQTLARKDRR